MPFSMPASAEPQSVATQTKKDIKQAEKDAKKSAKKYEKEGWRLNGAGTLERNIYHHLVKTVEYGGNCESLEGNSNNATSIQAGISQASYVAAREYAKAQRMAIQTRAEGLNESDREHFLDGFEARVAEEINGEMRRSYTIYRKDGNRYEILTEFLIDEDAAERSRKRALRRTAEELDVTKEIADKISNFVQGK